MQTMIQLLGSVAVTVGRNPARLLKLERQEQTVLGYLLLDPGRAVDRMQLIESLWPERDADSGCRCLSTALWRLRRALAPVDGIQVETGRGAGIRIRAAATVTVDLWTFRQLADRIVNSSTYRGQPRLSPEHLAQLEAATDLYHGPLLAGLDAAWGAEERQTVEEDFLKCLVLLGRHHDASAEHERALELYRRVLRHDPAREEIHRAAMISYEKLGLREMALRQYATCIAEMRNRLAVDVTRETSRLAAAISCGTIASAPSAGIPANPENVRSQLTLLYARMRDATLAVADLLQACEDVELRAPGLADANPR